MSLSFKKEKEKEKIKDNIVNPLRTQLDCKSKLIISKFQEYIYIQRERERERERERKKSNYNKKL